MDDSNDDLAETPEALEDNDPLAEAIEIYQNILEHVVDVFPQHSLSVVHLAACLFEETCNRTLPRTPRGDMLVKSAKELAPAVITNLNKKKSETEVKINVPGSDEIN